MMCINCFSLQKEILLLIISLLATVISRGTSLLHTHSDIPRPALPSIESRKFNPYKYCDTYGTVLEMSSSSDSLGQTFSREEGDPHVETVLFVECGFGNDSHGAKQVLKHLSW